MHKVYATYQIDCYMYIHTLIIKMFLLFLLHLVEEHVLVLLDL